MAGVEVLMPIVNRLVYCLWMRM